MSVVLQPSRHSEKRLALSSSEKMIPRTTQNAETEPKIQPRFTSSENKIVTTVTMNAAKTSQAVLRAIVFFLIQTPPISAPVQRASLKRKCEWVSEDVNEDGACDNDIVQQLTACHSVRV